MSLLGLDEALEDMRKEGQPGMKEKKSQDVAKRKREGRKKDPRGLGIYSESGPEDMFIFPET